MKKLLKILFAALLLSAATNSTTKIAAQEPNKEPQETLKPAKNQEAVALFLNLYDRYAKDAKNKTEFDRLMEKSLENRPGARERAKRVMETFRKIPLEQRKAMLGKWADVPGKTTISDERYQTVFDQVAMQKNEIDKMDLAIEKKDPDLPRSKMSPKDLKEAKDKKPVTDNGGKDNMESFYPDLDPLLLVWERQNHVATSNHDLQRIGLCFRGLRCKEETDWDGGSAADEVYIVATVIDAGNITTSKLPMGGHYEANETYEDLDTGDKRGGPTRYIWHTRAGATQIALIVTVIEKDDSDMEDVINFIEDVTEFGSTLCMARGRGFWCSMGTTALTNGLEFFLLDLPFENKDDLIETVVWGGDNGDFFISEREMSNYLDQADQEWKDIMFDFRTLHDKYEGANYRVMFRFQWED